MRLFFANKTNFANKKPDWGIFCSYCKLSHLGHLSMRIQQKPLGSNTWLQFALTGNAVYGS